MKRALFLVDVQNDFCPGGSLSVPFGDRVVPVINKIKDKFDIVLASRDWHPADHKSFDINNPGTKKFDVIELNDKDMIIWPSHCVQDTDGAKFHPELNMKDVTIFTKGDKNDEHPFSGFVGIDESGLTVEKFLTDNKVDEVYVVGLAGDYCVKETALDCSVFFKTYLIIDATRFIGQMTPVVENLAENGVMIINSNDLDIFLNDDKFHYSENRKKPGYQVFHF